MPESDSIAKRNETEKLFHDKKFAENVRDSYYAQGFMRIVIQDFLKKIGEIEHSTLLELGCGDGWFTKVLAGKGADVWSCDISEEAVRKARKKFSGSSYEDRVHVDQMAAENLTYPDNYFDVVVGSAILHHVDLKASLTEVRRVLKQNGKAYFMEPLGHNALLNLYRRLTPHLRSKDEKPLRIEHFRLVKDIFPALTVDYYYLTAPFALIMHFVGMKRLMLRSRDALWSLDKKILKVASAMNKYCWYSIVTLEKRQNT